MGRLLFSTAGPSGFMADTKEVKAVEEAKRTLSQEQQLSLIHIFYSICKQIGQDFSDPHLISDELPWDGGVQISEKMQTFFA